MEVLEEIAVKEVQELALRALPNSRAYDANDNGFKIRLIEHGRTIIGHLHVSVTDRSISYSPSLQSRADKLEREFNSKYGNGQFTTYPLPK